MTERKPTCVACKGAGGGANYTAGDGIKIESNEISADTSVLATKTELPDMDDYQPKLTAGSGIKITDDVISSEIEGFTLYSENDWGRFINNSAVTEDLLIRLSYQIKGMLYIPKGTPTTFLINNAFGTDGNPTLSNNIIAYTGNTVGSILNSNNSVRLNVGKLNISSDSNGIYSINYTLDESYNFAKQTHIYLYRRA